MWSLNSSHILAWPGESPFNSRHVGLAVDPANKLAVLSWATEDLKHERRIVREKDIALAQMITTTTHQAPPQLLIE
jgi:hypothetical protein